MKNEHQEDLQRILEFQRERDWGQFHQPKNLAISLALEASEVLELFQWTGTNDVPQGKKNRLMASRQRRKQSR